MSELKSSMIQKVFKNVWVRAIVRNSQNPEYVWQLARYSYENNA
jgi:hypothetical protein